MLSRAIACVAASLAFAGAACARHEIPLDLSAIPRREAAVHAKKVALLPFVDSRTAADGSDEAEGFDYRGVEYIHTALNRMRGVPMHRITELVAQHLATARVFEQVILVLSPEQAPEADLIMQGKLRRMRGYVEANPPPKKSGRPQNERYVLAEVFLEDIEVRDARKEDRILLRLDAGWSIDEKRTYPEDADRDPWSVLGEALNRAMKDLAREIERADLSGRLLVKDRVALLVGAPEDPAAPFGRLTESPPEGWTVASTTTSTGATPLGWRSRDSRCRELRLEQQQSIRFNRALGPYRPAVFLWACPKDQRLTYNSLEEFPAQYLGTRGDGTNYFLRTIGESNWPNVLDEVRGHLAITPPRARYNFEVGNP